MKAFILGIAWLQIRKEGCPWIFRLLRVLPNRLIPIRVHGPIVVANFAFVPVGGIYEEDENTTLYDKKGRNAYSFSNFSHVLATRNTYSFPLWKHDRLARLIMQKHKIQ